MPDYEWIELYNASDEEINLKGWTLSRVGRGGEKIIQFDEDVKIPAGRYLLLLRDDIKETDADFVTVDVDHFITVDVKEAADRFYFVPDPESPEKLRITLAEDARRLKRKKERAQVMGKDSDHKREQERSPEETIKGLKEDIAQFKERLKQLEEKHKRVSSPKEH